MYIYLHIYHSSIRCWGLRAFFAGRLVRASDLRGRRQRALVIIIIIIIIIAIVVVIMIVMIAIAIVTRQRDFNIDNNNNNSNSNDYDSSNNDINTHGNSNLIVVTPRELGAFVTSSSHGFGSQGQTSSSIFVRLQPTSSIFIHSIWVLTLRTVSFQNFMFVFAA